MAGEIKATTEGVLEITKAEFEALPPNVRAALQFQKPLLVIDAVLMQQNPTVAVAFNGSIFNVTTPCRNVKCKYYLSGLKKDHFHAHNGRYILFGIIDIRDVIIEDSPPDVIVSS